MNELKVEDFKIREHQISRDSDKKILLIDSRVEISDEEMPLVHLDFPSQNNAEEFIKQNIKLINKQLHWLKENIDNIKSTILNNDYTSLAESWVKDMADNEDGCYIVDEKKISFPIKEDEFKNGLLISAIAIHFQEDEKDPILEIYVRCEPDYFYGHAILLYVYKDKNIKLVGLSG